nr:hypothetical protein [Candidatus Shapirobacteria bacterium]
NGVRTVSILKENNPQVITVEVGESNDTQTEIISGINEGDVIITSTISNTKTTKTNTSSSSSPFSGAGGGMMGGGIPRD